MSRHVKITLGVQQAKALLAAAGRGLDEWEYEHGDTPSARHEAGLGHERWECAKGLEAYRKLDLLIVEATNEQE